MLPIIPFLFLATSLAADLGCFSSVDTSSAKGFQTYGSQSSCSSACGSDYPYVAMRNGGYCYCLTSMPSSNQVADSQCDVKCNGYGAANCGGSSVFTVFAGSGTDPNAASNSAADSASASASSSGSAAGASSSSSSGSPSSGSDNAASSITSVANASGTNDSSAESVKYQTETQTSGSDSTATSGSSPQAQKKSSSVGPIVGGVVGGLAGALILGFVAFFLIRRHNSKDEDDEEEFYKKGASGGTIKRGVSSKSQKFNSVFDMPMSNPFVHPSDDFAEKKANSASAGDELSDPRLNPAMMGRRRLSEGSLADEADYSRKILGVANP